MTDGDGGASRQLEQSLIEIAIESWRFSRLFLRLINRLDAGDASRYSNQLRYFLQKLDEGLGVNGFKLVNVEGQPFDPGMAVSALNMADFAPDDGLLVDQMMEPIVMGPEGVRKFGTVMLRKAQT